MKKDPKIFLIHILESIKEIERYTHNISREEFLSDTQVQDAVIRRLEIIGEATKRVPVEVKRQIDIPWKQIAGMRDILIHDYFEVDIQAVWDTVVKDLPILKEAIQKLVSQL